MPHDVPGKHDGVHWHEPSGSKRAGFGEFKKQPTPYDAFMEAEGIPCFRGNGVRILEGTDLWIDDCDLRITNTHLNIALNFIGNMRDHLHGSAKVITTPFFADYAFVDLPGGEVIMPGHARADKTLIVS